eukprot:9341321-Lingulodinium_polyedra.AAC.1
MSMRMRMRMGMRTHARVCFIFTMFAQPGQDIFRTSTVTSPEHRPWRARSGHRRLTRTRRAGAARGRPNSQQ